MRCKSLLILWICLVHTACRNQSERPAQANKGETPPPADLTDVTSHSASTTITTGSLRAPLSRQYAGKIQAETLRHNTNIQAVAISADSRFLVVLDDGDSRSGRSEGQALHVWDLQQEDSNAKVISNLPSGMKMVLFSSQGNTAFAVGAGENYRTNRVYCWDARTWNITRTFDIEANSWDCGAVSPDGQRLILGGGFTRGLIGAWDLQSGATISRISHKVLGEGTEPRIIGHYDTVTNVQFSSNGNRLFTVGREHSVRFWDAQTFEELQVFDKFAHHFDRVILAPSEKLFAMVRLRPIIDFYSCDSGQLMATVDLSQQLKEITAAAFSPDSRFLVVGGGRRDDSSWVVDVSSSKTIQALTGQTDAVKCFAFAPSGRLLVSAHQNRSSALKNSLIRMFAVDDDGVFSAMESPPTLENNALPDKEPTSKPHPREIVKRGARGSLPFLMQECGYRWGYVFPDDVGAFIKAAIEPARTGSLDGRFLVATTVYRIPTSDRAQREAEAYRLRQIYGPGGKADPEVQEDRSDADEIAIQMSLPFRLYKSDSALDRERTKGVKGVRSVAVNRAERSPGWFLTADGRLANFAPQQAQMDLARGGILYCGESRQSKLIFRGLDSSSHSPNLRNLPYNDFDPKQEAARSFVCEIEIERLTYGPALDWQTAWGYYRQEAMETEEMDSDFILNWNFTGALAGLTPDYFRPTDSANPLVVSAMLVSAILRTKEGEVVASYHRD